MGRKNKTNINNPTSLKPILSILMQNIVKSIFNGISQFFICVDGKMWKSAAFPLKKKKPKKEKKQKLTVFICIPNNGINKNGYE